MAKYLEFTVEGSGQFPVDMLRYDGCYPTNSDDAIKMKYCDRCCNELTKEPRRIELLMRIEQDGQKEPTTARWESFGWKVVSSRKF